MYIAEVFTVEASGKRRGVFRCKRCTFAAAVEMFVAAQGEGRAQFFIGREEALRTAEERAERAAARIANGHLDLFPCPLCHRRRSHMGLALRCLLWCATLFWPATLAALIFVFYAGAKLGILQRLELMTPFVFVGILVFAMLAGVVRWRWRTALREAESTVKLRRFWEWEVPSGPRVIAVQDPASGAEAVWIGATRAEESEEDYVIPLQISAANGPYRAPLTQATLHFPAAGTCWLTMGAKRLSPLRTSSDVA